MFHLSFVLKNLSINSDSLYIHIHYELDGLTLIIGPQSVVMSAWKGFLKGMKGTHMLRGSLMLLILKPRYA